MTLPNQKTVTLKISRGKLCDLLLACDALEQNCPDTEKWGTLHDELKAMLDAFDARHGI